MNTIRRDGPVATCDRGVLQLRTVLSLSLSLPDSALFCLFTVCSTVVLVLCLLSLAQQQAVSGAATGRIRLDVAVTIINITLHRMLC